MSVVTVALDHFRQVNDNFGHQVGDEVLCLMAGRLRATFREEEDLIVRSGGEEFCVAVAGCDAEECAGILDRLRQAPDTPDPMSKVATTFDGGSERDRSAHVWDLLGNWAPAVTFSAGVATWIPGESLDDVVRRAEAACYRAEDDGRDRAYVHAGDVPVP